MAADVIYQLISAIGQLTAADVGWLVQLQHRVDGALVPVLQHLPARLPQDELVVDDLGGRRVEALHGPRLDGGLAHQPPAPVSLLQRTDQSVPI